MLTSSRGGSLGTPARPSSFFALAIAAWFALGSSPADAQILTEFYIPVPENEALETLNDVDADTGDDVRTFVSIVLPDACTVFYDHWEDGYEADVTAPAQRTTEIWGNGVDADGIAPRFDEDLGRLPGGTVLVLDNSVTTGMQSGDENPNAPGADALLRATLDFDGRDRVATTCSAAMTRAAWASAGTLNAGAVEVWPVADWGTQYVLPVGEDTNAADESFEIVNVSILALRDGTEIQIDHDADGNVDRTVRLDQGETHYVDSTSLDVNEGATVTASGPVQVDLLTGDEDSYWEGRWFALLPSERWDSCYYAPTDTQERLGSEGAGLAWVRTFLFNPNPEALLVDAVDGNGARERLSIPSGTSRHFDMPEDSVGVRFCSRDGRRFYAGGMVDHGNVGHDWGYYLVPAALLTSQLLVPWADGCDPTLEPGCTQNGSPLWVTPTCDTWIYADFDQDGTPDRIDLNGDGDTDDVVEGHDESTSHRGLFVQELDRILLHDASGDVSQTGAIVYSLEGPDQSGSLGCDLAGVWGQNAANANSGAPGIDVGTLAVPFGADLRVLMATNGENAATPEAAVPVDAGSTIIRTYVVRNTGDYVVENVTVDDSRLPAGRVRCAGSDTARIASIRPGAAVNCFAMDVARPGLLEGSVVVVGTPVSAVGHLADHDVSASDTSYTLGSGTVAPESESAARSRCLRRIGGECAAAPSRPRGIARALRR